MICPHCRREIANYSQACCYCGRQIRYQPQLPKIPPNDTQYFEKFRPLLYDRSETIISVLGNSMAQTFISTGALSNGFAILTDKRVYFKGTCLTRSGDKFVKSNQQKSVNVEDITGTGTTSINPIGTLILSIVMCILGFFLSAITRYENASSAFFLFFFISSIVLFISYLIQRTQIFEIVFAGGSIAFNLRFIPPEEASIFQKRLNILKDRSRKHATSTAPPTAPPTVSQAPLSAPQQLIQYKELLDKGIITQAEFEAKKKQLLNI